MTLSTHSLFCMRIPLHDFINHGNRCHELLRLYYPKRVCTINARIFSNDHRDIHNTDVSSNGSQSKKELLEHKERKKNEANKLSERGGGRVADSL